MATKDNNKGLLSRMVKFIRKPSPDDLESEVSVMGRESELSKLALKERIERKRQDDIIRRREFNHLRKLRNDAPVTGRYVAGQRVDFQSSAGFNPEGRALTVKKIDAIEAQLSKHWFDMKQGDVAKSAPSIPRLTDVAASDSVRANAATLPGPLAEVFEEEVFEGEGRPTTPDMLESVDYEVSKSAPPQVVAFMNSHHSVLESAIGEFSSSNLQSLELGDGLADPGLQEAAIRYADGDEAGAEAILLAILQADQEQSELAAVCAAALFDLYRATGQQASFDVVSMDFAQRFGRSPPEWFSIPDMLASRAPVLLVQAAVPVGGATRDGVWGCPTLLDLTGVKALRALFSATGTPRHLDWSGLMQISPDAVHELAALFEQWCAQPYTLYFAGEDALESVLEEATPGADKRVDTVWWRLRLDALRILNLQEAFDTVALDFCMLYEVSPPSWVDATCECIHERLGSAAPAPHVAAESADAQEPEAVVVELVGKVLGDAVDVLDKLQGGAETVGTLTISCAKLIRVDFSAAGSILNWVAAQQSGGGQVLFTDVPRLVAAFFTVMGIHEHARVLVRTK